MTIIVAKIQSAGGWVPFDDFMSWALYTPCLGYYARDTMKFGAMPQSGSDFVTAPELTPLFGRVLAGQLQQALDATQTDQVWEFGAGSGALAGQLMEALHNLGFTVARYTIVELSATLRARQQQVLAPWGDRVCWVDSLPDSMQGVVVGNEVLDAMPVKLLVRKANAWYERGVACASGAAQNAFEWEDRLTDLRPPVDIEGHGDYLTEIHQQGDAFIHTLADKLERGAAFFIDYGFPEKEYYHPQRHMGTVMCHMGHQSDMNPLLDVGRKDVTAHVNFTGTALAGQNAGLHVLGYTSQARFLINSGLPAMLDAATLRQRSAAQKLIMEHEMGELFKVLCFCTEGAVNLSGFSVGDRRHYL